MFSSRQFRYFYRMPYLIIIAFVVLYLMMRYFSTNQLAVEIGLKKNPRISISDAKEGMACCISGTVVYGGRKLTAPFSQRECSYYHVKVEKHSGGKHQRYYTILEEKKSGDVIIRDGDAYALVQTGMLMESYIVPDKSYVSGFLNDASPELEAYLHKHGQSSEGVLGMNRDLHYYEGVLEEGETVSVSGKGVWKKTKDLRLNLPVDQVLLILPDGEETVFMTDEPSINRQLNS